MAAPPSRSRSFGAPLRPVPSGEQVGKGNTKNLLLEEHKKLSRSRSRQRLFGAAKSSRNISVSLAENFTSSKEALAHASRSHIASRSHRTPTPLKESLSRGLPQRSASTRSLQYPASMYFETARGMSSDDDSIGSCDSINRRQLFDVTDKKGVSQDCSDDDSMADHWDDEHQEQQSASSKNTATSLGDSQASFLGWTSFNPTSWYHNHLLNQLDPEATEDRDSFDVPPSPPTMPLYSMQEKIKTLQRQALPSKTSHSHPPSTSHPPAPGSFSTERYFAQAEAFGRVDQSTNLMDSSHWSHSARNGPSRQRRGRRTAPQNFTPSRLKEDQSLRKTIPPDDNGSQQKWFWFWRTRRSGTNGTKAQPSLSSTMPSPPPAPSLWNHSFNGIHTTTTNSGTIDKHTSAHSYFPSTGPPSSLPSAVRNTLFSICLVCSGAVDGTQARRRIFWIVLGVICILLVAAAVVPASVVISQKRAADRLSRFKDTVTELERRDSMVSVLLRQRITTAKAVSDVRMPAFKALQWLVEEDPAKLTTRYELLHELIPRFVLVTLHFATSSSQTWTQNDHWLTNKHVCSWYGIKCQSAPASSTGGIVTHLNLTSNQLHGRLPLELKGLSELRVIDLSHNSLQGPISEEWTTGWIHLQSWRFQDNMLTGALPSQWNMPFLQELFFFNNQLTGPLPTFGRQTLKVLYLQNNRFSGSLPSGMRGWTNLRYLHLHRNRIVGSIPPEINRLSRLEELSLQDTDIVGTIPANLKMLRLGNCDLGGPIPEIFHNLAELTDLQLQGNRFRSNLPTSFSSLSKLRWLAIESSELSGTLPPEWSGLTNLQVLVAHDNDLTGSLRGDFLGKLTKLRHLSLHTNFFLGSLPTEIRILSDLGELFLQGNNFRGPLVSEIGMLSTLATLKISQNHLEGAVPLDVCELRHNKKLATLETDCNVGIQCDCCTECM